MTQPVAPQTFDPDRRLAIVGLILSLVVPPVGAIVSSVVLIRARRARRVEPAAIGGFVIGIVGSLVFVAAVFYVMQVLAGTVGPCAELGPGTHQQGLFTYDCES